MSDITSTLSLWFFSNSGQIITIILFGAAAVRYVSNTQKNKIQEAKDAMTSLINQRTNDINTKIDNLSISLRSEMKHYEDQTKIIKGYTDKEIQDLKNTVFNFRRKYNDDETR